MAQILVIDFETHYSTEYSLTRMTTEEYVRNEQFQALCLGVMDYNSKLSFVIEGPQRVKTWLQEQDWSKTVVICHHAQFDCFILSQIYSVKPRSIICTLSMARAVHGTLAPMSLGALAQRYELEAKTVPYNAFRGKRWEDMDGTLIRQLSRGCLHDVQLTYKIAKELLKSFPKQELLVVDLTVRAYTEPVILGDAPLWRSIAVEEAQRKNEALIELNVTEKQLQSTAQLKQLLEDCGEEVPSKLGKNGPIPCVAATDEYMQELAGRDDRAGALARARIDVRSTIAETRAARLAAIAERGPLPVYLKYFAANTSRWGGGESTNLQNLPRQLDVSIENRLRYGLMAPAGHKFVVVDFAQVEYRILCALAGQMDKLDALREGRDLYCEFGTKLFGRTITKDDKIERYFAKKIVLGCGYGTGKDKAAKTAQAEGFKFDRSTTDRAIDLYREEHHKVVEFWDRCNGILQFIAHNRGEEVSAVNIPVIFGGNKIILPNGLSYTPELVWCASERSWFRRTQRGGSTIATSSGQTSWSTPEEFLRAGYTRYWGGGLCLSGSTLVLAQSGWKRLDCIVFEDKLWDGREFVSHSGLLYKGRAFTVSVDGVQMTPTHKVLTNDEAWRCAAQCEGHKRANVWIPDCYRNSSFGWKTSMVELPLCVRKSSNEKRKRSPSFSSTGVETFLRLYGGEKGYTWDDLSPSLQRMAWYEATLRDTVSRGLQMVWGAWHKSMQQMGEQLPVFLGGYGGNLQKGPLYRSDRQQWGLRTEQLPVVNTEGECQEQEEKVYDIINCGPRKRFVVAGYNGPLIVHNCEWLCQALARIRLSDLILRAYNNGAGIRPCLLVHDEYVCIVPNAVAEKYLERLITLASEPSPWWPDGPPFAAEGRVAERYGE